MTLQCLYLANIFHSEMIPCQEYHIPTNFFPMMLDAYFIVPQITIAIEFGVHDEGVSSILCL